MTRRPTATFPPPAKGDELARARQERDVLRSGLQVVAATGSDECKTCRENADMARYVLEQIAGHREGE